MDMEQFYKNNYRIVYGYLFSLCRDRNWAEDLTSETFLRGIQKLHSYDGSVKISTWLCTIGRNLYLNECRQRSRAAPLEDYVAAENQNPEELLFQKERMRSLIKLMDQLEEPKRQLLLLRQQGLTFREIGEALEKSETWARVSYFRLKENLLKRMEDMK